MSSNHDIKTKAASKAPAKDVKPQPRTQDVGSALRTVYQQAVSEKIPDEMMDLLGKLD